MPAVPGATSPADTLPEEQKAARTLIDLLNQEQALLIAADIDALPMVTERKAPVVALMSELATRRHRALASTGLAASEAGMQEWVAARQNGKPLHGVAGVAWNVLLSMARQAQEINRINGLLITTHLSRNQAALSVLRGQNGSGNLYGPDGQSASRGMGRGVVAG